MLRVRFRLRTEPSLSRLFKREWVDVEVSLLVVVLAVVDGLYHLLVGAVSLLYSGFVHPFFDGILDGVIDIVKCLAEWFAVGANATLLGEVVAFIVDVIDIASTFTTSVGDAQFIAKKPVNLKEEVVASVPCSLGLERQKTGVIVLLIFCPEDVTSHADVLCFIVDAELLCQVVQPYVPAIHLQFLKDSPKGVYCLSCPCDLVGRCCMICHNDMILKFTILYNNFGRCSRILPPTLHR